MCNAGTGVVTHVLGTPTVTQCYALDPALPSNPSPSRFDNSPKTFAPLS